MYWRRTSASASVSPGKELWSNGQRHVAHIPESSRHVQADEELEVRLQLLRSLIAVSYTRLLPIFAPDIQCEGVAV